MAVRGNVSAQQIQGYPSDSTKFLAGDNSWAVPSGSSGGSFFSLTAPPAVAGLTWVNQGSASASDQGVPDSLFLKAPANASDSLRCLVKTAPSTPWVFTIAIVFDSPGANFNGLGIVARESSSGKILTLHFGNSNGYQVSFQRWNSATSFASTVQQRFYSAPGSLLFLRMRDDGTTNITCSCSHNLNDTSNSPDFSNVFTTIGRTSFLTIDQIGVFANSNNSLVCSGFIPHWTEA